MEYWKIYDEGHQFYLNWPYDCNHFVADWTIDIGTYPSKVSCQPFHYEIPIWNFGFRPVENYSNTLAHFRPCLLVSKKTKLYLKNADMRPFWKIYFINIFSIIGLLLLNCKSYILFITQRQTKSLTVVCNKWSWDDWWNIGECWWCPSYKIRHNNSEQKLRGP